MTALQGGSALITGGSGGIGAAVAELLVREGMAVTIVGRRPEMLSAAAAPLRDLGGEVFEVAADLSAFDGVATAVKAHRDRFGRLDVLVNSAGIALASKPARQQPDEIEQLLSIDLAAVLLLYHETIDLLLEAAEERGVAHVVNLSSLTGRHPQRWLAVYSAAKAAIIAYTHAMNQSFAARGVVSTAVCPGFVATAMSEDAKDLRLEEMIPAEDVAELIGAVLRLSRRSYVPELHIARPTSSDPSGL